MRLSSVLALVALPCLVGALKNGLPIPISKRSVLHRADGHVDITKVQASRHHAIEKIERGLDAFERNTGRPHLLASKLRHPSSVRRAAGNETLDYKPVRWYGPITVGTPHQTFTVQIDTGSTDFFVPDVSCGESCQGHNLYDPSQSSTVQHVGKPVNLTYAGGAWASVEQYTDAVTLAGYTATGQTFGSATSMSGFSVIHAAADGLLGLAYQSLSRFQTPSVFQSLVSQGQVPEPVFGLYLTQSNDSELFIGGVNSEHYKGSITYVPVEQQGFWQTSFDNVRVNGNRVLGNSSVIIDSGTSLIFGDTNSVRTIYENIPGSAAIGSGRWTFPCNTSATVAITFGGTTFPISNNTLSLGPVGSNNCVGSISGFDNLEFWIIGDSFLQNVYTVFDLGNNRVGFASLPSTT